MTTELFVAAISVGVAIIALALSVVQTWRAARQSAIASRALAIGFALDQLTLVIRDAQRPQWFRPFRRPELEFALLIPRLALQLNKRDSAVALWATSRVVLMQHTVSDAGVLRIAIDLVAKLASWHTGALKTSWFTESLAEGPNMDQPGRARKASKSIWKGVGMAVELVVLGLIAGGLRWIWEQVSPSEFRRMFARSA